MVEKESRELDIYEEKTLKSTRMSTFKKERGGAIPVREEYELKREAANREGLELNQVLDEGVRLKGYPPTWTTTRGHEFKVKLERWMLTSRNADDSGKLTRTTMPCSSVTTVVHVRAEFTWCKKVNFMCMNESGEGEGHHGEGFKSWDCAEEAIAVLGDRTWL